MNTHTDKTSKDRSQLVVGDTFPKKDGGNSIFQFVDNRPEAIAQLKLQELTNNSPRISQLRSFQSMTDNRPRSSFSFIGRDIPRYTSAFSSPKLSTQAPIQRQPFGLADPEAIDRFSDQHSEFEKTLKNEGVAETLAQAKTFLFNILKTNNPEMPMPKIVFGEIEDPLTRGQFDSKNWTVTINSKAFPQKGTSIKDFPQLMNTLYHESRHCEQYWHAARKLATSMRNNHEKISSELNIPIKIAISANKNMYPSKKTNKNKNKNLHIRLGIIQKWINQFKQSGQKAILSSMVTGVATNKVQVENKMNQAKKYLDEHQEEKKSDQYKFFLEQYRENYKKYRLWEHEDDAWNVGNALEEKIIEKQKAKLRESLIFFLKFNSIISKEEDDGLGEILINVELTSKQIIQEKIYVEELAERVVAIKQTYQQISSLKEDDNDKYLSIISKLQQCADLIKGDKMVGAANLYLEAMSTINEN